jgi:hypothetical protein
MISLTITLSALVLLISWDTSEAETQSIPVESDDTLSRNR